MNKRMTADVYTCHDCKQRLSQGEMERHSTSDCMKYFEALADKRLELLKRCEWGAGIGRDVCPECLRHETKGHTADCELAEAIDGQN